MSEAILEPPAATQGVARPAERRATAWGDLCRSVLGALVQAPHRCADGIACVALPMRALLDVPEPLRSAMPGELLRSVSSRQRSYIAGRLCAHHALARLGASGATPLDRHDSGRPVWPQGWCGSIAHTDEVAYAAVATSTRWRGIGLDAEGIVDDELVAPIRRTCMHDSEWQLLGDSDSNFLATLLFSAKESIYKAAAPMVGRFFDFMQAELIAVDWADRRLDFRARPGGDLDGVVNGCSTYFGLDGSTVHTVTMLARPSQETR